MGHAKIKNMGTDKNTEYIVSTNTQAWRELEKTLQNKTFFKGLVASIKEVKG